MSELIKALFKRPEKESDIIRRELLEEIDEVNDDLRCAHSSFNNATEPELVEACVYEINALHARYSFLLRKLRENGINDASRVLIPVGARRYR